MLCTGILNLQCNLKGASRSALRQSSSWDIFVCACMQDPSFTSNKMNNNDWTQNIVLGASFPKQPDVTIVNSDQGKKKNLKKIGILPCFSLLFFIHRGIRWPELHRARRLWAACSEYPSTSRGRWTSEEWIHTSESSEDHLAMKPFTDEDVEIYIQSKVRLYLSRFSVSHTRCWFWRVPNLTVSCSPAVFISETRLGEVSWELYF